MTRLLVALLLSTCLSCVAQETSAPADLPIPERPERPAPPERRESGATVPTPTQWEGAIGANLSYRPDYQGSDKRIVKISPAVFLRYGRFTITNASGFVTRRADDVVRGLGLDMLKSDRLRVNLALRFDAGRSESTSSALAGLGNIKPTVRTRLTANWRGDDGLRAGASWSVDAFGRGGGSYGDVSVGWERRLTDSTTGSIGAALSLAGDRYMQTYYGINAVQAARSSYAVYEPGAGLRDIALSANTRTEINADWVMLTGAGVSRLLGPAARSPLTRQANGWGVNVGLARRF